MHAGRIPPKVWRPCFLDFQQCVSWTWEEQKACATVSSSNCWEIRRRRWRHWYVALFADACTGWGAGKMPVMPRCKFWCIWSCSVPIRIPCCYFFWESLGWRMCWCGCIACCPKYTEQYLKFLFVLSCHFVGCERVSESYCCGHGCTEVSKQPERTEHRMELETLRRCIARGLVNKSDKAWSLVSILLRIIARIIVAIYLIILFSCMWAAVALEISEQLNNFLSWSGVG